ncbi:type II CAAX endopeptidase family protein [Clostridium sp. BL-8]|uniref:CPBP family intramembrane glutamic endopeptidase n=1 Tax=Clostridium sp. BL-8 TaxID=349938 RepID=UPI00098C40D4|nr:type II CAAX endopeptidase family protein [Clostridium sp. BL-8]OOM77969.1 CAAX amino terminal protease self- immunity [Clostridium sp. BL-8]
MSNEPQIIKKLIKRDFNKLGLTILMKEIIAYVVAIVFAMIVMAEQTVRNPNTSYDQLTGILNNGTYSGVMSIVAVMLSFIPFLIYRGRKFFEYDLKIKNKDFTMRTVIIGLVIVLSANSLLVFFSDILELGLNFMGLSANSALEDLESLNELAIPMIIYSCILGPVIEEFIYRGAILRSLEKYGKKVAILGSAILFGLMHGNFFQIFMAIGLGIVLGYLAMEYSIKLTILLHIINNISVQIISQMAIGLNSETEKLVNYSFINIGLFILIIFLLYYRSSIKKWLQANKMQDGIMSKFFTSILIIVVVALDLFKVINGISIIS